MYCVKRTTTRRRVPLSPHRLLEVCSLLCDAVLARHGEKNFRASISSVGVKCEVAFNASKLPLASHHALSGFSLSRHPRPFEHARVGLSVLSCARESGR